jgi:hypothetical protein
MRITIIACDVFTREISYHIALSPHIVDISFLPLGAHNEPSRLKSLIQARIDAVEHDMRTCDAIGLAFGLCGNATSGLVARSHSLVIPRAHDCCTILLGSQEAYTRYFGESPSSAYSSAGYWERGAHSLGKKDTVTYGDKTVSFAEFASLYGEEYAREMMEQLSGKETGSITYIDTSETSHLSCKAQCKEYADSVERPFRLIPGNSSLLQNLVFGNWDTKDFCIIPPGHSVTPLYDAVEIFKAQSPRVDK